MPAHEHILSLLAKYTHDSCQSPSVTSQHLFHLRLEWSVVISIALDTASLPQRPELSYLLL
ncbi:hypothetical protein MBAV_002340 [Candidatus Magnetobacterium bavaricum]|uniref:Uncharacterized protein n=1 Tax=Candidatus Magnetobacterium bavaricum TaxID=29290 RepID=A0A0F3GUD8_9BACT|nr:hypothetical protein MBAV_002340 [Candidatus Magnetobacterium bavaricum]